ncbi:MAG: O-antigen ligase family protein [Anaerolineae bacterium]|nr:O-antigen ligase family protein [Anaerolineae bacterium]
MIAPHRRGDAWERRMVKMQPLKTDAYSRAVSAILWAVVLATLAVILALGPIRWAFVLVVGVGIGLIVLVRPWVGLLFIAVTIPMGPLIPLPIHVGATDANELLLLLVIAAWLAQGVVRREVVVPHPPLLLPMLLLLGAYLATIPGAWSLRAGLVDTAKWVEGLVLYLVVVALLPPRRVPWLIGAVLLAATAEAMLGLYQFIRAIGPPQFVVLERFVRAYGTFRQPNPFGGYLGLVAPIAISLTWWAAIQVWREWRTSDKWRSSALLALLGASTGTVIVGLIVSWSRGAWLGFVAATIVIIVARGWRTITAVALTIATGVAVIILGGYARSPATAALWSRMAGLGHYMHFIDPRTVEITDKNFPIIQRLAQWWAAWRMFSDHPWLGVGIGNYATAYPAYALPRWYLSLGHAHNYYLNAAAETGLIGLAAYLTAGIATLSWVGRQALKGDGWQQALAIGILGVLAHLSVHNLFDNLYVQHMILHLALLLGTLAVLCASSARREDTAKRFRAQLA